MGLGGEKCRRDDAIAFAWCFPPSRAHGIFKSMTKRRLLRWSLILMILAAFAVWLEPTRVVWGWLRGVLPGAADELLVDLRLVPARHIPDAGLVC